MTLAEQYPDLFCRRCERLGSQCSCTEKVRLRTAWVAVCWCGWASTPHWGVDDASAEATVHEATHNDGADT